MAQLIIANFSKDLAFGLYTIRVPEPGTCLLMIVGLAGARFSPPTCNLALI